MADVRALLKAKRQEIRISHPLASYSANNQLRCTVCGTIIKYASAWEGHLGSKAHRTKVAHRREAEKESGKRKVDEEDSDDGSEGNQVKKPRLGQLTEDTPPATSSSFPADFFSDTSRAPLPPASDESDDEQQPIPPPPVTQGDSTIDQEWEKFKREVVDPADNQDIFHDATVFAEPEIASETPEGFPVLQPNEDSEPMKKSDDGESRKKKEQEERELIMDRLLDEERAQEEADMKVSVMKGRVDALKKKREAAKRTKKTM